MKNQFAGAAFVSCALAVGALWLGRGSMTAQAQPPAAASAVSALSLGDKIGKICALRYQDGAESRPTDTGTLTQVDDNWVVLDVLDFKRNDTITDASGHKDLRAVYAKTKRQIWVATKLITAVNFDGNVIVR